MDYYIGLMSGTSADAIDCVLLAFPSTGKPALLATHQAPFPEDLRIAILSFNQPEHNELERACALNSQLGELFATSALEVMHRANLSARDIRAIGSHGQTVRHKPSGTHPFSLQLGNPSVIAERTGITTVADFRARDLAAGGQGAPLVPAFHQAMFQSTKAHRAIVNIGGIANVTYLPSDTGKSIMGFDTGPGNALLDEWNALHCGTSFDQNGIWAASGNIDTLLLNRLHSDPYFRIPPPKSTGRDYFNHDWLVKHLDPSRSLPTADVQATLLRLTTVSIARGLDIFLGPIAEVYVCGGGARNPTLMTALAEEFPAASAQTTAALGIDPGWVEACAFAWLAYRTMEGKSGNVPSVTGAQKAAILGGIYRA